jgi:hypothetical protein
MVKLFFLFSQFLIVLDFKLLDLYLKSFLLRIESVYRLFLLFIDLFLLIIDMLLLNIRLLKLVYGLLLLFNLARENMLTHFYLGLYICYSCMQVTLLRLLHRLRSYRLSYDWYLTARYSIFKVCYS